ncbi:MAG: SpoIIE family protein phosphatase, partial [Clostridia bacterium]
PKLLLDRFINVGVGLAFAFACIYILRALLVRGLKYRPSVEELVCGGALIVAFSKCLSAYNIFGIDIVRLLPPFIILVALFCVGRTFSVCVAFCIGLGQAIYMGELSTLALYIAMSVVAIVFCNLSKWASALAILLSDIAIVYFFKIYTPLSVLIFAPTLISALAFCCIPQKIVNLWADTLGKNNERFANRNIINKLRLNLSRKLFNLSEVFFTMNLTFKSMVVGAIPPDKAGVAIAKEVGDYICADCQQRNNCWRNNIEETERELTELTTCAMDRGKATILDLSNALVSRCGKINAILSATNSKVGEYKRYYNETNNSDNSRLLIGEQLIGVSQIMRNLASECKSKVYFDTAKEKEIAEQLTLGNILVKEVVVMTENNALSIVLTVSAKDVDSVELSSVVGKLVKCKLSVNQIEQTQDENWVMVYLTPVPNFQISYGYSAVAKSGSSVSGDTHSFINIGNGKFLLAVVDGMGSGENAEQMSNTAISLVENFYKAGFDNEVILTCVNRLLATGATETFSTVDICVIDLQKCICDFIKLGAPAGLIKTAGEVQFILGSSLPLGVLDEAKPTVTKKALSQGDIIVLASDGFFDSFADKNETAELLNSNKVLNPQLIARGLLDEALQRSGDIVKDDITVLVARIV